MAFYSPYTRRSDGKELDEALHQASDAIRKPPITIPKGQQRLEKIEDRVQASGYPTMVKDANTDSIETFQQSVRGFAESSKVLMNVLDEVAKIHPFMNVAVLAFKGVVTLELKRRDNDSKVIALHLRMQEMMSVLVELRNIKDPEHKAQDGTGLNARMKGLMQTTADNITACGNHCDNYSRKHVVVKLLKGPTYELGLADFATIFAERQGEIQRALTLHTAIKIDEATHTLETISSKMQSLFQALETSEEKALKTYVKDKGGMETFLSNDSELEELERRSQRLPQRAGPSRSTPTIVQFSGVQPSSAYHRHHQYTSRRPYSSYRTPYVSYGYGTNYVDEMDGAQRGARVNTLDVIRKQLSEDLKYSLEQNMVLFQQKLDVQTGQLVDEIDNRVKEIINAGPHDEIIDPDVRSVWIQHAWKRSVKARHFVLALHDHFLDKYSNASLVPQLGEDFTIRRALSQANQTADDRWTLKCLNIRTLQPVLEAFDDDSTGFITVKEVNLLTASKPRNWSLPQWLAYWAVGWHQTLWEYKGKIQDILTQIYSSFDVLTPNRTLVDLYLEHPIFGKIDRLLLALDPAGDDVNQIMRQKIESYRDAEEARLEKILESLSFDIDGPDTMTLLIVTGRVERYLFPLLYLLLKRQLDIIKVGSKYILHHNELKSGVQSIVQVFGAVADRIDTLSASVVHKNDAQILQYFEKVAFSMFKYLSDPDPFMGKIFDLDPSYPNERKVTEGLRPGILKYGVQQKMDRTAYDLLDVALRGSDLNLSGEWSGYCYHQNIEDTHGLMQILITNANMPDAKFYGRGHDIHGTFEILGQMRDDGKLEMTFVRSDIGFSDGETCPLVCEATLDVDRDTIFGTWGIQGVSRIGTLYLNRTPASLYRFRHINRPYDGHIARDRWTYAIQAVIHDLHIRLRLWSWSFFKARFAERKRFCQLWYCQNLTDHPHALSMSEQAELKKLERILHPADAQFYRSIARVQFTSTVHINAVTVCMYCKRMIIGDRIIRIDCFYGRDDESDRYGEADICTKCLHKVSWPCVLKLAHNLPTRFTNKTIEAYEHMFARRHRNYEAYPNLRTSTDLDVSQATRERQRSMDKAVPSQLASLSLGFMYKQRSGDLELEAHVRGRESPRESISPNGNDYQTIPKRRTSTPLTIINHVSGRQAICRSCGKANGPYWACIMCDGKHNRFHPLVKWLDDPVMRPNADAAGLDNPRKRRWRMGWGKLFS